jgi:hypothetical protein
MVIAIRKCGEIRWKFLNPILDLFLSRKAIFGRLKPGGTKRDAFVFSESTLGQGEKSLPFETNSRSKFPSLWRGMVRNTVIIQHDAARLHTLLDHVNKVIDGQCGGNPANFTGVIVFVCSLNGIEPKKRGRELVLEAPGIRIAEPFRN